MDVPDADARLWVFFKVDSSLCMYVSVYMSVWECGECDPFSFKNMLELYH